MTSSDSARSLSVSIEHLPAPARRMLSAEAPAPMKNMGARGVAPGLKPDAIVTLVCAFACGDDPKLRQTATETLEKLPRPVLEGAFSGDLQPAVLELIARSHSGDSTLVPKLIGAKRVESEALEILAERASEAIGEILAASDHVLLRFPRVIEKLYMNRHVRMSTADRLVDLAVRNDLELNIPAFKQAAAAIKDQLIPEATEERTFDDELFEQTERLAQATAEPVDDTHEVDDEGKERVRDEFRPLFAQIAQMTVTQKIRRATLGNGAERMLLVRDTNRLVATAAASSPLLKEGDAARIAASRNVIDDVLRIIARNRDFTRNYQVKLNLVTNPRTPFTFSSRLVTHLRDNDLRSLSKSRNVPAAIQTAVRQQLERKRKRG